MKLTLRFKTSMYPHIPFFDRDFDEPFPKQFNHSIDVFFDMLTDPWGEIEHCTHFRKSGYAWLDLIMCRRSRFDCSLAKFARSKLALCTRRICHQDDMIIIGHALNLGRILQRIVDRQHFVISRYRNFMMLTNMMSSFFIKIWISLLSINRISS